MSDYYHLKVIRMRADLERLGVDDIWDLEEKKEFKELFDSKQEHHMTIAPTEERFIDYVIFDRCEGLGDFGFARMLTESEIQKYLPLFQQLDPTVKPDELRLVEYCFYNCSEAPDYFEVEEV